MKKFLIALQFLTILPIRIPGRIKEEETAASIAYFPLAGLVIGLILAATVFVFGFLPPAVTIALVIASSILLTGGLHLDGFADTCDGFYAGRTKERRLQIMRDPHIGTMGAIAIIILLLLKFTILLNLPKQILWRTLVIMPLFAKFWLVLACYKSRYAREEGKAKLFIGKSRARTVLITGILTLGLSFALGGVKAIIAYVFSSICLFLFMNYIKKRIGGMTGDTAGAINETAETLLIFFILIAWKI